MNDAHISAQIEQLEMVLDRLECNVDGFRIELGRLKALVRLDPPAVEPWQTEDVQPVTGGRPIKCLSCGEAIAAWDDTGRLRWCCLTCRTAYEETGRSL